MSDLENMLRRVLDEQLKPVRQELRQTMEEQLQPIRQELQQVNIRLNTLEDGQQKLHQDVIIIKKDTTTIKSDLKAVWDDILKLDNRLVKQEKIAVIKKGAL